MTHEEYLKIRGVEAWNKWREENPEVRPDLRNANLYWAELPGANLRNANLQGAELQGADLEDAILWGADLRGAKIRCAYLSRVDLRDAQLPTSEDESCIHGTSFLDLASCSGAEAATFSEPDCFPQYMARAFEFVHREDTEDAKRWPDFVALVRESLEAFKALTALYPDSAPPRALVEAVQTITSELIKYLAKHPEELYKIKSRQFEELIAEILASYGWQVHLTKATRDGGYDLFAISKDQAGVETSWLIECKRYRKDRTIGIDIARALYGVRNVAMPAGMLMLATTSSFSQEVKALKASRYDLELKDYEGILEWLNEYRPNPDGRLYIKDNRLVLPEDETADGDSPDEER